MSIKPTTRYVITCKWGNPLHGREIPKQGIKRPTTIIIRNLAAQV